jgi:hypothetical protein
VEGSHTWSRKFSDASLGGGRKLTDLIVASLAIHHVFRTPLPVCVCVYVCVCGVYVVRVCLCVVCVCVYVCVCGVYVVRVVCVCVCGVYGVCIGCSV